MQMKGKVASIEIVPHQKFLSPVQNTEKLLEMKKEEMNMKYSVDAIVPLTRRPFAMDHICSKLANSEIAAVPNSKTEG